MDYSYKTNVEIDTSFDPIVNRAVRLSDLIASRDIMKKALRQTSKVRERIIVLQVNVKSKLSLEALDLHLLLSREMARDCR